MSVDKLMAEQQQQLQLLRGLVTGLRGVVAHTEDECSEGAELLRQARATTTDGALGKMIDAHLARYGRNNG